MPLIIPPSFYKEPVTEQEKKNDKKTRIEALLFGFGFLVVMIVCIWLCEKYG